MIFLSFFFFLGKRVRSEWLPLRCCCFLLLGFKKRKGEREREKERRERERLEKRGERENRKRERDERNNNTKKIKELHFPTNIFTKIAYLERESRESERI